MPRPLALRISRSAPAPRDTNTAAPSSDSKCQFSWERGSNGSWLLTDDEAEKRSVPKSPPRAPLPSPPSSRYVRVIHDAAPMALPSTAGVVYRARNADSASTPPRRADDDDDGDASTRCDAASGGLAFHYALWLLTPIVTQAYLPSAPQLAEALDQALPEPEWPMRCTRARGLELPTPGIAHGRAYSPKC